ncbi:MAG TPA: potassium-transporting ATPase subunit C [Candidatus Acidoferrales bacterium]|nr:potassium-transporting ATPase subunit C [Candidatus Acidoferrales bacterium]
MIKELGPGLRLTIAFTILTGIIYPAVMTGISEAIFPRQANGSLIRVDGKIVGSRLIGQLFSKPGYFHPRPSAAGNGYDATQSGGSNLGPTSAKLILGTTSTDSKGKETVSFDGINDRIVHYCLDNNIPYESSVPLDRFKDPQGNLDDVKLIDAFNDPKNPLVFTPKLPIPSDAVTGSASGLDPDISPANAELQLARIAKVRGVRPAQVKPLVAEFTHRADWGFLGEPRVNVLRLNVALDQRFPATKSQSADAAAGQKAAVMR